MTETAVVLDESALLGRPVHMGHFNPSHKLCGDPEIRGLLAPGTAITCGDCIEAYENHECRSCLAGEKP